MNNQRGLSLVEILGSIVVIGILLTMLSAIVVQTVQHTNDNERSDQAVTLSRNIGEEIKYILRNLHVQDPNLSIPTGYQSLHIPDSAGFVDLPVDLANLWDNPTYTQTILYPGENNHQFTVQIIFEHMPVSAIQINNPRPTSGVPSSINVDPSPNIRKAVITLESAATGKSYRHEVLLDF